MKCWNCNSELTDNNLFYPIIKPLNIIFTGVLYLYAPSIKLRLDMSKPTYVCHCGATTCPHAKHSRKTIKRGLSNASNKNNAKGRKH